MVSLSHQKEGKPMVTKKDYLDYLAGAEGLTGRELSKWWESWVTAHCKAHPTFKRSAVERYLALWCWLGRGC